MNKYKIIQCVIGNNYKVCEWEADNKELAVKEFLDINPAYKNRNIIAEQI